MKPKRIILVFDEPINLPGLRVVLESRGYQVLRCETEKARQALLQCSSIDLQLIGPRMPVPEESAVPMLVRPSDYSMAQLLEKIRVALIRKRGPKKVVA